MFCDGGVGLSDELDGISRENMANIEDYLYVLPIEVLK